VRTLLSIFVLGAVKATCKRLNVPPGQSDVGTGTVQRIKSEMAT
jgi:hypothetical protein